VTVNKANVKLWVEALRSGEFEQCRGTLHAKKYDDEFNVVGWTHCCLDVANVIAERNGVKVELRAGATSLHPEVQEWLGFDRQNPMIADKNPDESACGCGDTACQTGVGAIWANDHLFWDFGQIADAVEQRYLNVQDTESSVSTTTEGSTIGGS
jgi:hypothetical protein